MSRAGRNHRDGWAGLMFVAIGGGAIVAASHYPLGTALRMGPGYFPTMLGAILILFGVYVLLKGLRRPRPIEGRWSLRALVMLPLSLVVFGMLMERAGFALAVAALVVGSAAAGREFKLIEVLLLTAFLTGLYVAIFIWGIGLPYPLLKGF